MTSQLVKKNIDQYIQGLSLELQSIIFYFIPTMGTAKIIKKVINIYEIDRKYTKRYNMYYIKNTLSFVDYIYDSNYNPTANRSFQLSIRNLFCKISQVIGLTFTSLGKLNFLKDFCLFLDK